MQAGSICIYASNTQNSVCPQWAETAPLVLGIAGEKVLEASALYSFELHHEKFRLQNNADYSHMIGDGFPDLYFRFADLPTAKAQLERWEGIDANVQRTAGPTQSV